MLHHGCVVPVPGGNQSYCVQSQKVELMVNKLHNSTYTRFHRKRIVMQMLHIHTCTHERDSDAYVAHTYMHMGKG